MQKRVVPYFIAMSIALLLVMMVAYWHSSQVAQLYDDAMHRDIQHFAEALAQGDTPKAQAQALTAILNDVHHDTFNYVASATGSLIGTIAFTGIIVLTAALGFASKRARSDGPAA